MWDPLLETSGEVIGFYNREFDPFSNFSSFAVEWKGRLWPTSEHAYQAAHFLDTYPDIVEEIYKATSAHNAKKIAHRNEDKFPADWDSKKVSIMEDICLHKLQQHAYVEQKLLETEDKEIVEDSPKDYFWGRGLNKDGRNELGKIWMKLRGKLKVSNIL